MKHNLIVGSLLVCSWGYDQTNINAYQVTRITPKGVYVREIQTEEVPGSAGFMCNSVRVKKDCFIDNGRHTFNNGPDNKETFHRCSDKTILIKGRYNATLTTETDKHYCSWYA